MKDRKIYLVSHFIVLSVCSICTASRGRISDGEC
jgi:hypothetical protein